MSKLNKNTFVDKVNEYYDNNSALFLKLGVDKSHFNIHQPLWTSETSNYAEAVNHSNLQIANTIDETFENAISEPAKIVDLGCGVGGSLIYLQQYFKSKKYEFEGLTLSQKQVDISKKIMKQLDITVNIKQGNFQNTFRHFKNVDVIYMIESFLHSPNYKQLLEEVSKTLRHNGLFIIVDDFINIKATNSKEKKWIQQYKEKWLIGSLLEMEELLNTSEKNELQLVSSKNFTPYIKQNLRNKLLHLLNFPLNILPFQYTYINSLTGGIARQVCLKQNLINYKMMVFQKE